MYLVKHKILFYRDHRHKNLRCFKMRHAWENIEPRNLKNRKNSSIKNVQRNTKSCSQEISNMLGCRKWDILLLHIWSSQLYPWWMFQQRIKHSAWLVNEVRWTAPALLSFDPQTSEIWTLVHWWRNNMRKKHPKKSKDFEICNPNIRFKYSIPTIFAFY